MSRTEQFGHLSYEPTVTARRRRFEFVDKERGRCFGFGEAKDRKRLL